MSGLYAEESLLQVLFVTVLLGGGAAALAGRAIARTWRPPWHLAVYMLLLGMAVRFVHFALFAGSLLSPASYVVDTVYLLVVAALAWRRTRASQMATQYHWLFERDGLLSWRPRAGGEQNTAAGGPKAG